MHITVCKRCHRILALSFSDHGDRKNRSKISNWKAKRKKDRPENYFDTHMGYGNLEKAIKLIPESYRHHMAFCGSKNVGDVYDMSDGEVDRYEL